MALGADQRGGLTGHLSFYRFAMVADQTGNCPACLALAQHGGPFAFWADAMLLGCRGHVFVSDGGGCREIPLVPSCTVHRQSRSGRYCPTSCKVLRFNQRQKVIKSPWPRHNPVAIGQVDLPSTAAMRSHVLDATALLRLCLAGSATNPRT